MAEGDLARLKRAAGAAARAGDHEAAIALFRQVGGIDPRNTAAPPSSVRRWSPIEGEATKAVCSAESGKRMPSGGTYVIGAGALSPRAMVERFTTLMRITTMARSSLKRISARASQSNTPRGESVTSWRTICTS